jgi:hypothetical protein
VPNCLLRDISKVPSCVHTLALLVHPVPTDTYI